MPKQPGYELRQETPTRFSTRVTNRYGEQKRFVLSETVLMDPRTGDTKHRWQVSSNTTDDGPEETHGYHRFSDAKAMLETLVTVFQQTG